MIVGVVFTRHLLFLQILFSLNLCKNVLFSDFSNPIFSVSVTLTIMVLHVVTPIQEKQHKASNCHLGAQCVCIEVVEEAGNLGGFLGKVSASLGLGGFQKERFQRLQSSFH